MRRLGLVIIFLITAALPAAAQLGKRISVQAGTPEDKELTAINAAATAQQKLALLDKFSAEHPSGDMALMACRLYVDVYSSLKNYAKVYEYGDKALAIDPNDLQVGVQLVRAAQLQPNNAKLFTYGLEVGKMATRYKALPPPAGFPADEWEAQKKQALTTAQPSIHWVAGALYHAATTAAPATRAADITQHLLAFGRRQVLRPEALNLNDCLHQALPMLNHYFGIGISIELELDDAIGPVVIDREQLGLVLLQLADNARNAMPHGGRLRISTFNAPAVQDLYGRRRVEPGVILTFADDGVGMDAATRDRIFEPFFSTQSIPVANGLGLSSVYGIIQQSRGCIDCQSSPGKGTTFRIFLPAAAEAAASVDSLGSPTGTH